MQSLFSKQSFSFTTAMSLLMLAGAATAQTASAGKSLAADTRFYIPPPAPGSQQQVLSLLTTGNFKGAELVTAMELTPQAVWLASGTPAQVLTTVTQTMRGAALQRAVPLFVVYNVPGRDCGGYSAGGAQTTAAYQAWINAVAQGIGSGKAIVALEPDALANLPSDCGYNPSVVNIPQATADRYTQLQYAVTTLEAGAATSVYLDAGNSAFQGVGTIAGRLVTAGVQQAQGYFSNVSNYRETSYELKFDNWVSECIAFGTSSADGGWRLGNFSYCASQYYSPLGPVNVNDITTWVYTDQWFAQNLGTATATTHFLIDTSRNGQGPLTAVVYGNAPYNQPGSVVSTIGNGSWCNPPGRGLGATPTANTGVPMLDAYLWVKTPGQSDGMCDAAGGVRAWNYTAYTQPSWPTTAATQSVFDPLWGVNDPVAGGWFSQQALDLVRNASPSLLR